MIRSMTGYGRSEMLSDSCRIAVEIKSVNNRYLDIGIKMPRQLNQLEAQIRAELKKYMLRGKVDVYISYEDLTESNMTVKYNDRIAKEYWKYFRQMADEFGIDNDIRVSSLARFPDVLVMEEEPADPEGIWENLEKVVHEAAQKFDESRIREGEFLCANMLQKLDEMLDHVAFIEEKAPELVERFRTALRDKVSELLEASNIDEARIAQEVTIHADKICVDEELVRLRSHIEATREELRRGGSIGRKLDFIAQEMNRESNTILSKSDDREVSDHAIELKTSVEKIREQVQNIE
ncbi:MAG: YicC family protein [Lachnospiraceae bacterium]|nr:YicC family protein [Lachnospiraceae bacterium]MDO4408123.1 YicC/YloC family endoribonuclease [Eubacteriales bacterium]